MFSFYYQSRLNVHLRGGGVLDCEDMRAGCPWGWRPTAIRRPIPTWPSRPPRDTGPVPPNAPQGTSIYPKTAGLPSSVG